MKLFFTITPNGSQFKVVNAIEDADRFASLADTALRRDQVIGTAMADHVFKLIDAAYMSDGLASVRAWTVSL